MKKGFHHSPEAREKLRIIGKNYPIERMEKMRASRTIASFKKQSETMKKKFPPGPTHFNFGSHRSKETKEKMRIAKLGKYHGSDNINWKGGIWRHTKGYVFILSPHHPFCGKRRYVAEHRLVIEKQIGRFLKPKEASHHINKIKDDNRPENLMAFKTQPAHNSFEAGHSINPSDIIFDGRNL